MCGIVGAISKTPVNQLLYDALLLVQHRGQDAAGIVTSDGQRLHMHKGPGLVRDVFRTRDMRSLPGHLGIAHCRYPTAGSAFSSGEAQPFYVNSPFGIVLGHNGNLTNAEQLKQEMFRTDLRHINTNSDSEVLLNVLAHEVEQAARGPRLDPDTIFSAVASVHRRCRGAYAVVAMIAGAGVLVYYAFVFFSLKDLRFTVPWLGLGIDFDLRLYHFSSFILLALAGFCLIMAWFVKLMVLVWLSKLTVPFTGLLTPVTLKA